MIVPVIEAKCGCEFEVIALHLDAISQAERFGLKRWRRCKDHPKPEVK